MTQALTLYCSGWETGLTSPRANTQFNVTTGNVSITPVAARSFNYGLRLVMSSSRSLATGEVTLTGSTRSYGVFHVRFEVFPDNDYQLVQLREAAGTRFPCGFEFNAATQRIRPYIRDETGNVDYAGSDGDALLEGVWYRVDFRITRPTNTERRIEWYLAEEGQAPVAQPAFHQTGLAFTSYWGTIVFGESSDRGNTATGEIWFDDILVLDWGVPPLEPAFPVGDLRVTAFRTASDGVHNNPSSFIDDTGASPPSSVWDRLDEEWGSGTDASDYVRQYVVGGGDYLECALTPRPQDWAADTPAYGMRATYTYNYGGPVGAANFTFGIRDVVRNHWVQVVSPTSGGPTLVDGTDDGIPYVGQPSEWLGEHFETRFRFRFGFSTDVVPPPQMHRWVAEVAYAPYVISGEGWGVLLG